MRRASSTSSVRRIRLAAASWFAVFAPLAALGALLKVFWLSAVAVTAVLLGAVVVALLHTREVRAEKREEEEARDRERVGRLRTPIRSVSEVSPYEVGVDHEASGIAEGDAPYVRRDRDAQLRAALTEAGERSDASLIVVTGLSKAGKSRTLFAVASEVVPDARLIAPRNRAALSALLGPDGLLPQIAGPVVVWLDDVEDFVRVGEHGMDPSVLRSLATEKRPVLVLATYGGKGQRRLSESERGQLAEPISELLAHATEITLTGQLSEREQSEARAIYPAEAADQMAHGIGEYMIAAPRLERKLTTGRHEGGDFCPEGVAVVWAAIDWQRMGMTDPISDQLLGELYGNYLSGLEPTEKRFERGLEWALAPLYSSVALLSRDGGLRPFDHIVAYADRELARTIDERSWDHITEVVKDGDAFRAGLMAYSRQSLPRAERAWQRAAASEVAEVAGPAALNLGILLERRGDIEGAEKAYRRGDERGYALVAPNLGVLLEQRGDIEGAEEAYRRGDERGNGVAASNLGLLLARRGDIEGAENAYRRGDERGEAAAASNLGVLLEARGAIEGAENAYRRGDERGSGDASHNVGVLLASRGDIEGAEEAFRRGDERGSGSAAHNLGFLLEARGDIEGAEAAYRRADNRGDANAAHNLGVLLEARGDIEGAEAAYRRADERGSGGASSNLGVLLAERGDIGGAEEAIRRGDERGSGDASHNLGVLLEGRGDIESAEVAYERAATSDDVSTTERSQAALRRLRGET